MQYPVAEMDETLGAPDNKSFLKNLRLRLFHFKLVCVQEGNQQGQWASGDRDGQCVIICY